VLAFQFSWFQHHDLPSVSRMARDTLVLVPLGLPFFLPFALSDRLGWNYWSCFVVGLALATAAIGTWLTLMANR
jgi:hypothetical protein